MRKNRMMRLASVLLILTMVTTCAISGTFAKYTTSAEASDTARVAKWGVTVTASGNDAFATEYEAVGGADGNTVAEDSDTVTVKTNSSSTDKLVAPGTTGSLGGLSIGGTPEVMVTVAATAELKLTGWKIGEDDPETTDDERTEYCPLVFTVGSEKIKIDGATITDVAGLEAAVEAKFTALAAAGNVAANTDLTRSVSVSWEWPFEGDDVKDTALGNLATAPKIEFSCSATVTQVD